MRLPRRHCRCLASLGLALVLLFSLCPTCTLADDPPIEGPVGGVDVDLAWQLGGAITALDVVGDYAYLGIGPRLVIIDVSDPANPVEVGRSDVLPNPETGEPEPYTEIRDIVVVDDTAYLAAVARESDVILARVDLHDPSVPRPLQGLLVSRCSLYPYHPDSLRVWLVADQLIVGTVEKVSFSPCSSLYAIGLTEDPLAVDATYQIYAHNMLCDLASGDGSLFVLSMADDMHYQIEWEVLKLPLETGRSDGTDKHFWTPDYGHSYLRRVLPATWGMAVTTDTRVYCLDLESAPHWRDPDTVPSCELSTDDTVDATMMPTRDYGVVISESELVVVDLRDASEPTVSGRAPVGGARVDAEGDCAYVLDNDTLQIVELSDPTNPQLAGSWTQPDWSAISHVEVLSDECLVVSAASELLAIDTPAGGAPAILGSLDVGVSINDFCLLEDESSDLLLATDGLGLLPVDLRTDGIPVLDLAEQPEPCEVAYVNVAQTSWQEEYYGGETRTERRALALTDGQELVTFSSVNGQHCGQSGTHVCEGFDVDQVSGRYAYVGRAVWEREYDYTGQIEVYDLSSWGAPVVAVVPTDAAISSIKLEASRLYTSGGVSSGACGSTAYSKLMAFDLTNPRLPGCVDVSTFGECEGTAIGAASSDFLAAEVGQWACYNNVNAGDYWGSSIAVFRVHGGADLQYVCSMPCSLWTEPVAFADDTLITLDPAYGLVAWELTDLPAWGAFIESEIQYAPPGAPEVSTPRENRQFDQYASGCEYMSEPFHTGWFPSRVEGYTYHEGDYYLWARVRESDPEVGTFQLSAEPWYTQINPGTHVRFDGQAADGVWSWQRAAKLDDLYLYGDAAQFEESGWTEVHWELVMNHPSAAVDCLYLTDSPDLLPPEITPCVPAGLALLPMILR